MTDFILHHFSLSKTRLTAHLTVLAMARDNRPKIIDVERSLGIWFEAGLHRHKGGYKIAEVKELRLEIDRLTAYYGFYSIDEIRKSEELRDAITVLFNNVGPRFWPDPPVDRHRWLADATHNNLSGRYPHDLFFSDPQDCARHVPSDIHDKLPLMSSRLHDLFTDLVVLKCIKFFENHGRHPTHQESAFNFEVDPEYVEAGGYPSRCEQKSRASETKRTAAPAPVAQMLPSPATTCSTGSQTVCEDRTPLTFKPSSNARESSGGRERTEEHPQKRKMPTQDSGTKKARQEPMVSLSLVTRPFSVRQSLTAAQMKALGSPSTGSSQFSVGHRLPPAHSMQGRSSPQTPVPDVSQSQQPTSSKFLDGHPSKARGHGDPEPQATTNQHPAQTCNSDAGQMTQGLTATPRTSWTSINGQDIDQGSALDMAPSALAPNDELAEASENSARQENFDANTPQGMIVGTVLTQQELTPTNDDSGEGVQPLRTTQTIPDNFVDLTEDSDDEPVMPSIRE